MTEEIKEKKYLFWFVAIHHNRVEEYIKHLKKYITPETSYIIAKEVAKGVHHSTNGEHIHIACEMELDTYNKFHRNIHVEQLKLRRKANEDGGKQVGRVHNVRDELKMLSYTVKSENIIYENIDLKTIQDYIENSYPKKEDWDTAIIDYIKLHYRGDEILIEDLIIDYYVQNSKKRVLSRHKIKQLIVKFLMYEIEQTPDVRNKIKWVLNN